MKSCFRCHRMLPLSEFYRHPAMADGHLGKCKDCTKSDAHNVRAQRLEYYRQYDRSRANQPERAEARRSYNQTTRGQTVRHETAHKWDHANAHKKRTHALVYKALVSGRLVRKPCEVCGEEKVEAHHPDYSKPLEVRWLCIKHHAQEHRRLRGHLRPDEIGH